MRRVGAGAEDVKGMVWTAVDGAGRSDIVAVIAGHFRSFHFAT